MSTDPKQDLAAIIIARYPSFDPLSAEGIAEAVIAAGWVSPEWAAAREAAARREALLEAAEGIRSLYAAAHPGCCDWCGWSLSSHGRSQYGLDCPGGTSPAAGRGHLRVVRQATAALAEPERDEERGND